MEKYSAEGGRQITIGIRNPCNYNCFYCIGAGHKQPLIRFDLEAIRRNYEHIDDFTLTAFECGTGEPTLHPQIQNLLELVLQHGPVVTFPTNLSFHPKYWLPDRNTSMMSVITTLHPENESNLNRFLEHIFYLKDRDVSVGVSFVCHPKRYHKKDFYKELLARFDVPLTMTPFKGVYNKIDYPSGYNVLERSEMGWQYAMDLSFETTWRNFKGIPCLAGYIDLFMNAKGQIFRCAYDSKPLKEPYCRAMPCRVDFCGCGFLLEALNDRGPAHWNHWRKKAGLRTLPELTVPYEARLAERREIYNRLRRRYEKTMTQSISEHFSEALQKLFTGDESIDFIGIGRFFSQLAKNRHFNEQRIGHLFDNNSEKHGKLVFGKPITPMNGFPRQQVSRKVLLSVQYPENLEADVIRWLQGEPVELYRLASHGEDMIELKRIL